jgi:phage I-like protein
MWQRGQISLGELSSDGFHRSWIMMFAQGRYEHPQYGELDFSRERLARIKANFDQRVRKIDLALDSNHDQNQATGWVEQMELREAQPDGAPAGLWGLVRWTPLGVQLLTDQVYRYFSPEFVDSWTDPQTGQTFEDVQLGGGLTNRPFLKELTPVQLAEKDGVSRKPWGQVKKSMLPRSAFLDQGEPGKKSTWRLPVYEGAGPLDSDGCYTKRGPLNINGVRAALAALGGAHTGTAMTGVPAGVRQKLQRWVAQYGGSSADSATESKQAGEVAGMAVKRKTPKDPKDLKALANKPSAEGAAEDDSEDAADGGDDEDAEQLDDSDDGEEDAEGAVEDDSEDAADGGDDEDAEDENAAVAATSNTHGAFAGRHRHGKFGMHTHASDGDHSDAPLKQVKQTPKGAGKGKQMSEERRDGEVKALTEQVAALQKQLHEQTVDKQLSEWGGATFTLAEKTAEGKTAKRSGRVGLSKAFREKYRAFALAEGFQMGEARFAKVNELLSLLLSDGLVDLSVRSLGSYEQEERTVFVQTGDPAAESRRLSERTHELAQEQFHKELRELSGDQVARLQRQAAKEIGYRRAAQ